jgi:hypothetical protein
MLLEYLERNDTGIQLMLPMPPHALQLLGEPPKPKLRRRRRCVPNGEQLGLLLEWVNEARSERKEGQREAPITWTEEDILFLREGLLCDALRTCLDARNSTETRRAIWAWIESDEEYPFSFRVCAQAVGTDHEELRQSFKFMAKRMEKERPGNAA